MNKTENLVTSATAGTTMMTLFSYLVSMAADKNFSEPEYLGTMIHRFMPSEAKKATQLAGWGAHYAVGLLFVIAYQELWQNGKIKKIIQWAHLRCSERHPCCFGLESQLESPSGTALDRLHQILYTTGTGTYRVRGLRDFNIPTARRKR